MVVVSAEACRYHIPYFYLSYFGALIYKFCAPTLWGVGKVGLWLEGSAPDQASGFKPGPGALCCVLRQGTFTPAVSLPTQVDKRLQASLTLGLTP